MAYSVTSKVFLFCFYSWARCPKDPEIVRARKSYIFSRTQIQSRTNKSSCTEISKRTCTTMHEQLELSPSDPPRWSCLYSYECTNYMKNSNMHLYISTDQYMPYLLACYMPPHWSINKYLRKVLITGKASLPVLPMSSTRQDLSFTSNLYPVFNNLWHAMLPSI